MGRIAAIDYGLKRIGIAISDDRKKIAFPLKTVPGGAKAIEAVKDALREKLPSIEKILVGFPLLLSGKEGDMAVLVRRFADELQASLNLQVELVDERFTSKLADQSLRENHLNRKERTDKMDTAAAATLLQTYLDGLV